MNASNDGAKSPSRRGKKRPGSRNDGNEHRIDRETLTHQRTGNRKKPKPTPPPPAALVKLLRSNKSVLKYFQSLQENLDYDVQKWKDRAKAYQSELEEYKQREAARVNALKSSTSMPVADSAGLDSVRALSRKSDTVRSPKLINSTPSYSTHDTLQRTASPAKDQSAVPGSESAPEDVANDKAHSTELQNSMIDEQTEASQAATNAQSQPNNEANEFHLSFSSDSSDEERENGTDLDNITPNKTAKNADLEQKMPAKTTEVVNLAPKKQHNRPGGTIEDHMFQFSSSDDSDDHGERHERNALQKPNKAGRCQSPVQTFDNEQVDANDVSSMFSLSSLDSDSSNDMTHAPNESLDLFAEACAYEQELDRSLQRRAEQALDRLGVELWTLEELSEASPDSPLVDVSDALRPSTAHESQQIEHGKDVDGPPHGNCPTHRWKPISKLQLWGNILRALRDITRVKYIIRIDDVRRTVDPAVDSTPAAADSSHPNEEFRYFPFMKKTFLPCFWNDAQHSDHRIPSHPAVQAVEDILVVLSFFDLFPIDATMHQQTTQHHQFSERLTSMARGSGSDENDHKRSHQATPPSIVDWVNVTTKSGHAEQCNLADEFISSLHGEIVNVWPQQERAMRSVEHYRDFEQSDPVHDTYPPHVDRAAVDDAENESTLMSGIISVKYVNRLASLVERCILCRLAVTMYLQRGDSEMAASLILEYVRAMTPSIGLHSASSDMDSTVTKNSMSSTDRGIKAPSQVPKSCEHQPVLSFCMLEAMIVHPTKVLSVFNGSAGTGDEGCDQRFPDHNATDAAWFFNALCLRTPEGATGQLIDILSQALLIVAEINRVRRQHGNERTTIYATIELAAWTRLNQKCLWLRCGEEATIDALVKKTVSIVSTRVLSAGTLQSAASHAMLAFCLQIGLIVCGDFGYTKEVFQTHLRPMITRQTGRIFTWTVCIPLACASAFKQMQMYFLSGHHQFTRTGDTTTPAAAWLPPSSSDSLPSQTLSLLMSIPADDSAVESSAQGESGKIAGVMMTLAVWCSAICADGENIIRTIVQFMTRQIHHVDFAASVDNRNDHECAEANRRILYDSTWESHNTWMYTVMSFLNSMPVVRVINLARRRDRMALFMAQAISANVLVIKAVPGNWHKTWESSMLENAVMDNTETKIAAGEERKDPSHVDFAHAFDGGGGLVEAEMRLVKTVGSLATLNSLVLPEWRPSDLRSFDTNAPATDHLVRLTPSEKACAMSHLTSWRGVRDCLSDISFQNAKMTSSQRTTTDVHSLVQGNDAAADGVNSDESRRRFSSTRMYKTFVARAGIAGYASGPATFSTNQDMDAQPVCIVMEDDAIMVDRFADRLSALLKELPRDFHFCSIGYARPKTAPIMPYSAEVGIPTSIWYLTGYILSLDGARYLLQSLPVRGPVDSWIGLKMFGNWDNAYGYRAGLGTASAARAEVELPSRKELASFFRFRAFVAMSPLCSQKMNESTTPSFSMASAESMNGTRTGMGGEKRRQNWRNKDTDIVYSGNN